MQRLRCQALSPSAHCHRWKEDLWSLSVKGVSAQSCKKGKQLRQSCCCGCCRWLPSSYMQAAGHTKPHFEPVSDCACWQARAQAKPDWEPSHKRARADGLMDEAYKPGPKHSRPHTPELDTPTSSSSVPRPVRRVRILLLLPTVCRQNTYLR